MEKCKDNLHIKDVYLIDLKDITKTMKDTIAQERRETMDNIMAILNKIGTNLDILTEQLEKTLNEIDNLNINN